MISFSQIGWFYLHTSVTTLWMYLPNYYDGLIYSLYYWKNILLVLWLNYFLPKIMFLSLRLVC